MIRGICINNVKLKLCLYIENKYLLKIINNLNSIDLEWIKRVEVTLWNKIYFINWYYSKFEIYIITKF